MSNLKLPQKLMLWGHSLADYQEMFALNDLDLTKRIIDCYPGAASFNAQLTSQGGQVISVDELYKQDQSTLKTYFDHAFPIMVERIRQQLGQFDWQHAISLDEFAATRQDGVKEFLADYPNGKQQQRYLADEITATPFANREFDLALCSHFLFGIRQQQDINYHVAVLTELCRIAEEVRLFPLVDSDGQLSPLVGPVLVALQQQDVGVEVREVPYQLQKNGNAMMRIWAKSCAL